MIENRYLNFPIHLLKNFLIDTKSVLSDICYYAIYENSLKLTKGDEMQCYKSSATYLNIELGNSEISFKRGKKLYIFTPENSPKVGLSVRLYWEFYSKEKSDFDKACLLGHLAIKSILQKKSYCKIDNKFWLARMDGKAKSTEFNNLSEPVLKFANIYQTKKIKNALRDNWGLVTYSKFTRGFYVSYKMSLDDLVYEAEKRRKSLKEKQNKIEENQAISRAIKLLYGKIE